jgi:hypothetical protein
LVSAFRGGKLSPPAAAKNVRTNSRIQHQNGTRRFLRRNMNIKPEENTRFECDNFSCDVDVFFKKDDIVVRFYDKSKEQKASEIIDLVIVDSGFGYLCLKFKGSDGLLSGFLDQEIFSNDKLIQTAINFIENLSSHSETAYIPHHIDIFKKTSYKEYNGEY